MNEDRDSEFKSYTDVLKTEGKIQFFLPTNPEQKEDPVKQVKKTSNGKKIPTKSMPVFFNEKMDLNRDMTVLMVKIHSEITGRKLTFLDVMAASGVRAIRLIKETDAISKVYINDLNSLALRYVRKNMELNDIEADKFQIFHEDAKHLLERFCHIKVPNQEKRLNYADIIDIDPFGSPSQYVPAAMQSIEIGGMLCLTATDTPVLFGIRKEQCVRKYLTKPIRTEYLKEMGTRILIHYAAKIAHLYELNIEPVLSLSSDHYVRVYMIIRKGITAINRNFESFGRQVYCNSCNFRGIEPFEVKGNNGRIDVCPLCNANLVKSGILWTGKLHSSIYTDKLKEHLENSDKSEYPSYNKMMKFLELSAKEDEFPGYFYSIPRTADSIDCAFPSFAIIQKRFAEKGFKSARTHFDPQGLKTDANIRDVEGILKELAKERELQD